ncbi:flagellar hook capping FlgD N-terminal domain-containing protein [Sporosarcina sp. E16_8]|uniref:flagellar hook capping FlgD N-terminal domain-containing protein n=1 Tax=Sporosarcina sp. E16_8 TaxID=2789295 RepID=UPI001A935D9F|nr:flagellar hook capping FlgD N-terminal domain-containing protein [Sporosarcina sp. E16_8]MBO0585780.1 flagellar hook assembly protein FlgD [Sporosarcina sp. E16_8]
MTIEGQKPINSDMYLANKKKEERQTGNSVMGKDDFMKLLITQMQNQDPTNPMKESETIAQMAQMAALEQSMNMAKSFEKFAEAQNQSQLIQYNSFVGKEIKWHELAVGEDGKPVIGEDGKPVVNEGINQIVSIKYDNGNVIFIMDDRKELTPGNISEVMGSAGGTNSLVEASMLIGKFVGYLDGEIEKSGKVVSVSNKDGKLQYVLEDGTRIDGKKFTSISDKELPVTEQPKSEKPTG